MSTPAPNDDTQRELEQRALRNVRGLVDKMEGHDAHDTRTQRRYLVGIVVGGIVVMLILALGVWSLSRGRSDARVIESSVPAKQPASTPTPR